ncbi:MAG TPA: hypothetical protein VI612_00210 [Candidatus Nanoarchaeia archaeon]|nr:hypothetical protein [Candidatus Nanoarchaeia archaeon]
MNPVEGYIVRLLKSFGLPADAEFYLDSIAFQAQQSGQEQIAVMRGLDHAASIAKYYKCPIDALKLLDKAMPEYVQIRVNPDAKSGLEDLHRIEWEISQRGKKKLEITNLGARIKQHMLGITQP